LPYNEFLTYLVIILVPLIVFIALLYSMRMRGKEDKNVKNDKPSQKLENLPFNIVKSVSENEAVNAKDELKLFELEREILSDAIRHLYEANAEGKITETEREKLAKTYKSRMMNVKEAISKDESLVALHELEVMQEDLIKLFSDRFDKVGSKIEELRSRVDLKPVENIPLVGDTTSENVKEDLIKSKKKRKNKRELPVIGDQKTDAEKRIEKIRNEVERVLERLGQMEIEED